MFFKPALNVKKRLLFFRPILIALLGLIFSLLIQVQLVKVLQPIHGIMGRDRTFPHYYLNIN